MALISLPVMMRYKYNMRYATGVLAASGTHHAARPAVARADRARRPARPLGGRHVPGRVLGPSCSQVCMFRLFTFVLSVVKPHWVPAIPKSDLHAARLGAVEASACGASFPPRVLIFLVLGHAAAWACATPTEGGAMGVDRRAFVLAVIRNSAARPLSRHARSRHDRADRRRRRARSSASGTSSSRCRSRSPIAVLYVAVAYLCVARRGDPRPAQAHRRRLRSDDARSPRW